MMRFGVSAPAARELNDWLALVERVEALGFDALYVADHVGLFDPFVALGTAARVSERLVLGTYVLNCAFWNPLLLARAAATTDLLTNGRLMLGLGAGHAEIEFEQAGIVYPSARDRVTRLSHLVSSVRALLRGERVTDEYLGLTDAAVGFVPTQTRVPILIGGNGDRVLGIAARDADLIGLVGFRSGAGQVHSDLSHWTWEGLSERASFVRAANPAATHFDVLVQAVELTDDRQTTALAMAERTGVEAFAHLDSPFLLFGTDEEIAGHLGRLEALLGTCTVTIFEKDVDALAAHIKRYRSTRH